MQRKRSLKLPNGYGSVTHLSGSRDKPYGARITLKWGEDNKQIRKFIGYARTGA